MEAGAGTRCTWTWGEVSGLAADTPNRIIVAIWGDRDRQGRERPSTAPTTSLSSMATANIIERWTQWVPFLNKPHQVYISPYDPARHVWIVERGGGRSAHMEILKFTNDGKTLVMRLRRPEGSQIAMKLAPTRNRARIISAIPPASLFFRTAVSCLPDGYWNSRIVKYDASGRLPDGMGHTRNRARRVRSCPRRGDRPRTVACTSRIACNNRIQVFTENGHVHRAVATCYRSCWRLCR